MKLFLASEAKNDKTLYDLEKFIGGKLTDKEILYIATAANGEERNSWKSSSTIKKLKKLNIDLEIIELEDNNLNLDEYKNYDIIWFAGGVSAYLCYWIRRRKLDLKMKKWLENGMTLVGSSSGAMAMSETLNTSEWYIGAEEIGASLIPGIGLFDFEIYPHFEDNLYNEINSRWKKGKLYLLKDGESIEFVNNKIRVNGDERIIKK